LEIFNNSGEPWEGGNTNSRYIESNDLASWPYFLGSKKNVYPTTRAEVDYIFCLECGQPFQNLEQLSLEHLFESSRYDWISTTQAHMCTFWDGGKLFWSVTESLGNSICILYTILSPDAQ